MRGCCVGYVGPTSLPASPPASLPPPLVSTPESGPEPLPPGFVIAELHATAASIMVVIVTCVMDARGSIHRAHLSLWFFSDSAGQRVAVSDLLISVLHEHYKLKTTIRVRLRLQGSGRTARCASYRC